MSALSRSAALLLFTSMVVSGTARAGERSGSGREAPNVDQRTGNKLNKAIEHINAGRYVEAREVLTSLDIKRLSPYELGRVENLLAAVAQAQDKYAEAREHLNRAIASGGLNEQEVTQDRFQIAQLLLAEERWQQGAEALRAWIEGGAPPSALAYYLLAVANYQLQRYEAAVGPAQKAVELSERPPEGWLQLLVALRLERHEYEQALGPLRRLAALAPSKKTYWLQLSSVYGMLGRNEDALVPLQLAHAAGLLTEGSELERLADLLAAAGVPFHAARLLERALADHKLEGDAQAWEKLATTWMAARELEKAVEPLSRAAALTASGVVYLRLGELHLQLEQWPKAAEALSRALDRGGLASPGDASLLLGIALFRQHKLEEARTSFQRAVTSSKSSAQARDWLGFIAREAGPRGR